MFDFALDLPHRSWILQRSCAAKGRATLPMRSPPSPRALLHLGSHQRWDLENLTCQGWQPTFMETQNRPKDFLEVGKNTEKDKALPEELKNSDLFRFVTLLLSSSDPHLRGHFTFCGLEFQILMRESCVCNIDAACAVQPSWETLVNTSPRCRRSHNPHIAECSRGTVESDRSTRW